MRFEGAWPVFAVERYYKGSGSAELTVSDPLGGGASCSYFDQGGVVDHERDYLVFAYYSGDHGYSTNLCAGNASSDSPDYDASVAEVASITAEGDESTPWAIILPLAFVIPLAVLVVPAFLRRRGGR